MPRYDSKCLIPLLFLFTELDNNVRLGGEFGVIKGSTHCYFSHWDSFGIIGISATIKPTRANLPELQKEADLALFSLKKCEG